MLLNHFIIKVVYMTIRFVIVENNDKQISGFFL